MIANLIVYASLVLAVAFVVAWAARPDLRAWIERRKYQFQRAVQGYDCAQQTLSDSEGKSTP